MDIFIIVYDFLLTDRRTCIYDGSSHASLLKRFDEMNVSSYSKTEFPNNVDTFNRDDIKNSSQTLAERTIEY